MYITKIKLENIRCFKDPVIDLHGDKKSILIPGNNSTGKTALLRSIAMGLCDEASTSSLLRDLYGNFIKYGENEARITIELLENKNSKPWIIETILHYNKELDFERVSQKYYKESKDKYPNDKDEGWGNFPWKDIFVIGYGPYLRTEGNEAYDQYFAGDAVYTLFVPDHDFQISELSWRRMISYPKLKVNERKKINNEISSILVSILDLENEQVNIELKENGIFFIYDKLEVELKTVGDGYRALTTFVLDLLSWIYLKNVKEESGFDFSLENIKKINGIVIIDELEQHLHPLLQRKIVSQLHNIFENIQFIISTHSPLCVSGTADVGEISDPEYVIYSSYINEEGNADLEELEVPRGLRYDQVLIDYFKLPTTINIVIADKVTRLRELFALDDLNKKETMELKLLESELEKYFPTLYEREEDRQTEIQMNKSRELLIKELNKIKAKE